MQVYFGSGGGGKEKEGWKSKKKMWMKLREGRYYITRKKGSRVSPQRKKRGSSRMKKD